MDRSFPLAIAAIAGLAGGVVSSYVAPSLVHAQSTVVPKVIASQNFVLVNERGQKLGEITIDPDGKPNIRLFDPAQSPYLPSVPGSGNIIWSALGEQFRPLGSR
jgi:hypothetical protein